MTDANHKVEVDEATGTETTGHSWDGIKELNTPLPRWWLYIFYASIVFAVIWMVLMPALPALPFTNSGHTRGLLGQSDRVEVMAEVNRLKAERSAQAGAFVDASLEQIETDRNLQQFALALGESLFGDNCATCHGAGGRGAKGYPSLADDVWLWDGTLEGIETTLQHGIRHEEDDDTRNSAMPSFGKDGLLPRETINDLTEYVLHVSGQDAEEDAVARAEPVFQQECSICHGEDAKGMRSEGAPNLTDAEWLYGGDRATIFETIYNARNSHMPAWSDRLDATSIKALAVYVHTLGGGE
ncbi:MAG: cytochrome-c oxidase, cbb3-type subunit III [Ponticaulis sp.]|nr:cytochrome-c oxidase, cbb3-type subunit III [Ponticaulis sp.]